VQPQVVALATGSIDDPRLQQLREVLPVAGETFDVELRLPASKRSAAVFAPRSAPDSRSARWSPRAS